MIQEFDSHYVPKQVIAMETFTFNNMVQAKKMINIKQIFENKLNYMILYLQIMLVGKFMMKGWFGMG